MSENTLEGWEFMHIAFWSPAWPLETNQNGIVTYVHAMRLGLEKRGHRVSIFTGKLDSPADGVFEVRRSRRSNLANRLARRNGPDASFNFSSDIAAAITREHRRHPMDVIEMEESFGWCADVQRKTSLPMVVKLHGPAFYRETWVEKIRREGLALANCRTIISPSQDTLRGTVKRYQLETEDAQVIVNPIMVDERAPVWNLENCNRKTILFVGRFDYNKGADVILQAMRAVWKDHPDARLIFVGPEHTLPSPSSPMQVGFWQYCEEIFGPHERWKISYLGPQPPSELKALRASAMVTVVASRWESQCYTLLEAMAQGCPVVSTDGGACPEAVQHGKTGLLARSGDPEHFARQLCTILGDPNAAVAIGAAARERVLTHYSLDRAVDAMLECYQRVISARRMHGTSVAA